MKNKSEKIIREKKILFLLKKAYPIEPALNFGF
jgi:hypothetical protein